MVIEINGLEKQFENKEGEPGFALEIGSLIFEANSLNFIMGHNGSGKSILIKLISGDIKPNNRHVEISQDGRRWYADRKAIGIVRQNVDESLALDLTVAENIIIHLNKISLLEQFFPKRKLLRKILNYLNNHDEILCKIQQPCKNLSGGQKQILAFLCVTLNNSPLLLLDEFLSATDQVAKNLLLKLAREYACSKSAAVLIASHDVDLALSIADRIIILKKGRLVNELRHGSKYWNKVLLERQLIV